MASVVTNTTLLGRAGIQVVAVTVHKTLYARARRVALWQRLSAVRLRVDTFDALAGGIADLAAGAVRFIETLDAGTCGVNALRGGP